MSTAPIHYLINELNAERLPLHYFPYLSTALDYMEKLEATLEVKQHQLDTIREVIMELSNKLEDNFTELKEITDPQERLAKCLELLHRVYSEEVPKIAQDNLAMRDLLVGLYKMWLTPSADKTVLLQMAMQTTKLIVPFLPVQEINENGSS